MITLYDHVIRGGQQADGRVMRGRRTAVVTSEIEGGVKRSSDWIYRHSTDSGRGVGECSREDGACAQESDAQAAGPARSRKSASPEQREGGRTFHLATG